MDSPGPGDPDDSLALEDPPLVDAPEPGGTDDRKALVTEESAADGHEEKDTPAGDEEKPDVDVTADVQKETPEQVEGPVEEFPADNTPDVIVTLVILPENFQHVLNVKAMTTGAELKDKVVAELPLPYDARSLCVTRNRTSRTTSRCWTSGSSPALPRDSNSSCASRRTSPSPSPRRWRCPRSSTSRCRRRAWCAF